MKPVSESRVFAWICIIALFGILVGISTNAWAGGECNGHDNCNTETTVLTGGDNISDNVASISGSRSYGVGLGSIDVDIAQCLGSESTGIIVVQWQRLKENPWCMADTLDAKGLHEAAARARCSIKSYSSLFQSKDECLSLSKAEPFQPQPPSMPEAAEDDDEHNREIEALYARLSVIESDRQSEAQRARSAAQAAREAARKAEEQREIDRQYAQQTLDALKEYQK